MVDAMFIKCREDECVISKAVLIVSGIREEGYREILGVRMGDVDAPF